VSTVRRKTKQRPNRQQEKCTSKANKVQHFLGIIVAKGVNGKSSPWKKKKRLGHHGEDRGKAVV